MPENPCAKLKVYDHKNPIVKEIARTQRNHFVF